MEYVLDTTKKIKEMCRYCNVEITETNICNIYNAINDLAEVVEYMAEKIKEQKNV